jgi:hypothetical protein
LKTGVYYVYGWLNRRAKMDYTNLTIGVQIAIANLKDQAISLGFDFPTQDITKVEPKELYDFYLELENYVETNSK